MESESANPLFIYLSFREGEVLINLNQIAMVRDIKDEELTLEMTNGKLVTVHGSEPVTRMIGLLAQYSMVPEGVPLAEFISAKSKMH